MHIYIKIYLFDRLKSQFLVHYSIICKNTDMYCTNCGNSVEDEAMFCGECGQKIIKEGAEKEDEKRFELIDKDEDEGENRSDNTKESPPKETNSSPDILKRIEEMMILEEAKKYANSEILKGLLWVGIGSLITFITYQFAEGGDTYFVLYGPIIYGAYIFLRGMFWRISPKSLINKVRGEAINDN